MEGVDGAVLGRNSHALEVIGVPNGFEVATYQQQVYLHSEWVVANCRK